MGLARPTLDAWRSEFDALLGALGSHRAFVLTGALDADRLAVQIELGRFVHEAGLAAPVVLPRAQDPVSTALARRLRVDLLTDDASIDDQLAHLGLDTSFDRALFGEAIEVLREQDHCPGARGLLRRLWTRTARERPLLVLTNSDDPAALAFARSLLRSGQAGLLVRSTGEAADGETELPLPALDLAGRERVLAGLAPLSGPTRSDLARECPAWPSAVADVLGRSMASLAWRGRELERASSATPALHGATETPARRALGVAALMAPFRVRAWRAAMTTLGDPRPDDALKVLVDGRLMAWRNGNFAVANEAIRREAVALADPADRGQWHRALADALQRFPFERGHHLVEAGAPSEAVDAVLSRDYARTPAPICIRQTDFCLPLLADDDARTGTCLESIAFAEIRFGLSTALQVSIDALASWNDRNPTLGRPFLLEILKGRVANMEGDRDAAITHLERARTMPVDDPYPVTIERSLGEVHIQSGNLLGAKTAFARAVEATFNPKTGVLSLLYLAWTNGALGDPARGLAQIEEVAHLTSATRRPTLHQIRGDLLRWNGQTDEAEREYRESMRWIEHLGHDTTATRFSLAHLDIARGRRPAIDADLDTIMESGGAWYRSAACAVALHLADLDPERAERALQRLERDGAYWDFDAVALLDAIAQSNRPEAARVQAVLDALKSASTAARR